MSKLNHTFLLIILITGLVWAWAPWATVYFEVPKVWWLSFSTASWLVLILWQQPTPLSLHFFKKILRQPVWLVLLTLTLWAIVTSMLGGDLQQSWLGNFYRHDGLVTWITWILMSALIASTASKATLIAITTWLGRWHWLSLILLVSWWLLGLAIPATKMIGWWDSGSVGLMFGNPSLLAGWLLVSAPLGKALDQQRRWVWIVHITLLILAMLATQSTLGLGAIGVWIIFEFAAKLKLHRFLVPTGLVLGVLAMIFGYVTQPLAFSVEGRQRIYSDGIQAWLAKPVTGWGWANTATAYQWVSDQYDHLSPLYIDKTHSVLLEFLVNTGVIGVVLYMAFILLLGRAWSRASDPLARVWLVSMALLVFHSQTNVISVSEEMIMWLMVGFAGRQIVHEP